MRVEVTQGYRKELYFLEFEFWQTSITILKTINSALCSKLQVSTNKNGIERNLNLIMQYFEKHFAILKLILRNESIANEKLKVIFSSVI